MTTSWRKRIQDRVMFGRGAKRLARFLLSSPLLTESRPYTKLYERRMGGQMASLSPKPSFIRVETTNRCTADCTFCPHRHMGRAENVMDMNLYRDILEQARRMDIKRVNLHGFGEPFMDPSILERISAAKTAGFESVTTNSNGASMNDRLIAGCIDLGLDEIFISIDAATEETYKKIRPGLSFQRVENNIRKFLAARQQQVRRKPKMYLSFVECPENAHEVHAFINKWRALADGVSISYLHNWGGDALPKGAPPRRGIRRDPCRHLWLGMDIHADGKVPLCCYDYDASILLGDLTKESLADVWYGSKLAAYRGRHRSRRYDSVPLCRNCDANNHNKSPWWLTA